MGMNHSMNKAQVDRVLNQFEATTSAMVGIQAKVSRMESYASATHKQQRMIARHFEVASRIIDRTTYSINTKSEAFKDHFAGGVDNIVDIVEHFERAVIQLGIRDLPYEMQMELGPLLVPAVVLVCIVTCSNAAFGFMLADDDNLRDAFLFGQANRTDSEPGSDSTLDPEEPQAINLLNVFAIFHICMIGVAVLYILGEVLRRVWRSVSSGRSKKAKRAKQALAASTKAAARTEALAETNEVEGNLTVDSEEDVLSPTTVLSNGSATSKGAAGVGTSPPGRWQQTEKKKFPSEQEFNDDSAHMPVSTMLRRARAFAEQQARKTSSSIPPADTLVPVSWLTALKNQNKPSDGGEAASAPPELKQVPSVGAL